MGDSCNKSCVTRNLGTLFVTKGYKLAFHVKQIATHFPPNF